MNLRKSNRKPSITLPSVFWMVVVLCSAAPASAQSEIARCYTLLQTVIDLRSSDRATERDILESRLQAATNALLCYDGRKEVQWLTWLMRQQIVALDGLQRYAAAQEVVDEFFSTYVGEADSAAVARFYMWDLKFKYRQGEFEKALASYHQGLDYAVKLPDERYKRYLLNAGSVYLAQGEFKEALRVYHDVRQTFTDVPSPTSPLFEVYGRMLVEEAEANLDLILYQNESGIDLDTVIVNLRHARSIFDLADSQARYTSAHSALGLAYALKNDMESAAPLLDFALTQIRQHDFRKQHLEALHRRALVSFLEKEYDHALSDIKQALALSQHYDIKEFETRLHYLKGQVYEELRRSEQALDAYEEAFNVAQNSAYGRDRHLFQLASASAFRVNKKLPSTTPYATYLPGLVGSLIALSLLAYFAWIAPRRRARTTQRVHSAASAQASPRAASLSSLQPFMPPSIARRLAYAWLLCFHLEQWRTQLDAFDPTLVDKLATQDPARQQELKPLILAVYALERALVGAEHAPLSNPYKSILNRLNEFFREQGWPDLPKGIYGFRHFFIERGWDQEPPAWLRQHLP